MKSALTLLTVSLLTATFLYPLFLSGIGKPVSWPLEILLAVGGVLGFWLLIKFRKEL
jgi:hypothetical protein